MTPSLFHGPEARGRAVLFSEEVGRPLREPLGDKGLKVADSREVVDLATLSGVGDKPPSLVLGPLDAATPEAADALLKTLEDLTEAPLRIVLWADHLSGVIPTIRSRTRAIWCPEGPTYLSPLAYLREDAEGLCEAILASDSVKILGILEGIGKDWPELLQALCLPLAEHLENPIAIETWLSIRRVLDGRGTVLTAADALLPGEM
jgi:hypothetical protein